MPIEASYAISTANELEQSQATQSEQKSSGDFAELLAQEEANDTAFAETATLAEASEYASAATETLNQAAVAESDEGKTEISESSLEKPCIAQFMVMTGCDFKTATRALYQYENWQDYLNDENRSIPDLSQAQQQLQAERQSGARSMVDGSYGARNDYVQPDPPEVTNPGQVLPAFNESGEVSGLGFYDAEGTEKTTASLTDRETILAHTDGFHIGRVALDTFAQKATGDSSARFEDLDLQSLAEHFPSYAEWTAQYGLEASVNGLEELAAQAETSEASASGIEDERDAGVENWQLALLTQKAQMTQMQYTLA
ncbi:MAG: hypothetical protein J5846_07355 [Desulfovibrio sp.]|nr:hypothetical protein [Desulfovibrio sp.]